VSGWLFDTSVLSAFAPGRPPLADVTLKWFEDRNDDLFIPAIAVTEIEAGIAKLRRLGSLRRAQDLREWFTAILTEYEDRVLPFDLRAARIAAELGDAAEAIGRHPGFADVATASIARAYELVVLTANRRHFEPLGVEVLNPLEAT
jgi:toxin FitB